MVIDREAATGNWSVCFSSLSGMVKSIALGFDSVVVNIKKVISKKAKSTIAVKSTRVEAFLLLTFPPFFPPAGGGV
jgi:hypothetical protein